MREEYDFTNAKKNPFAKKKKQITKKRKHYHHLLYMDQTHQEKQT